MKTSPRQQLPTTPESFAPMIESGAAELERELGGSAWDGEWMPSFNRTALNHSGIRAYVNPADPGIAHALELVACTAAAAHAAALTPGTDPIKAPGPAGRQVEVIRKARPRQLEPATQWRTGVLAAIVSGNADALAMLTAMLPADLVRIARNPPPPWFELETRALTSLFRRDVDAADRLLEAREFAMSDRVDQDWPRDVLAPEMELGTRALQGDVAKFDAAMLHAIERHHCYYGGDGKDDLRGQLALEPLAMACFAHDLGVTTNIESDYAPRWLIERTQP
jgi:hypothetical protein